MPASDILTLHCSLWVMLITKLAKKKKNTAFQGLWTCLMPQKPKKLKFWPARKQSWQHTLPSVVIRSTIIENYNATGEPSFDPKCSKMLAIKHKPNYSSFLLSSYGKIKHLIGSHDKTPYDTTCKTEVIKQFIKTSA